MRRGNGRAGNRTHRLTSRRIHQTGNREMKTSRAQRADHAGNRKMELAVRDILIAWVTMRDYVAPRPARNAGDCVARKRFARETVRSECLQHGHPCSEVGIVARATVRRGRLHIRISAVRPRSLHGQPCGASRTHRSSNLCDGASVDASGNRGAGAGFRA